MPDLLARDIMSRNVVVVRPDTTVQAIARLLLEKRIGGVPVVDDGLLRGMVTDGDLILKVSGPHLPPHIELLGGVIYLENPHEMNEHLRKAMGVTAQEIMSHPVVTVDPARPVRDVADLMIKKRIHRLPVVDGGRLVGIIARHDLISTLK